MPATCKCPNGHTWQANVLEDDLDTNSMVVEPGGCPECESDEMEIIEVTSYEGDFEYGDVQ